VGIFDRPDFEQMLKSGDWPKLVHYANYDKDRELSAQATKIAEREVYGLVEYLYETAVWTQQNSSNHGRRLPKRGIRQIDEATLLLRRIGAPAVAPLIASVRAYDDYGDPHEDARTLYFAVVFDLLEKMGALTVDGLRELAKMKDATISASAHDVLQHLVDRGLLESTGRS
jgi:hypothetical protein